MLRQMSELRTACCAAAVEVVGFSRMRCTGCGAWQRLRADKEAPLGKPAFARLQMPDQSKVEE